MRDDPRPHRLLFVCSGNQCRSPMAEGLAAGLAMDLGLDVEVGSAGTLGIVGVPAHPQMVAVAREIGVDLTAHRSRPLTAELVAWADRIYVMEEDHGLAVRALAPDLPDEVVVPLGPLAGQPRIADPIGSWLRRSYRTTRDELDVALRRALPALTRRRAGPPSAR